MRTIVGFGLALLLTIALSAPARAAAPGEAQSALQEATAALAAQPPQRDAARRALERAAATDDQGAASEANYRLGALDEEDDEYARALTRYRKSLAAKSVNSGVPWAPNASKRMQWLAVRSEGNFAPLVRLSRFKRDPALASDPEAVAAFAHDTEAFPPGIVRAEARTIVATAWLGPLHRPHDAVGMFRLSATDRTADGPTLLTAESGLVDALLTDGQLDEAAKEIKLHPDQLDPKVEPRLEQLRRRHTMLRAAEIALAAFVGLAVIAFVYARLKRGSLGEARRA
jgi:hypothetical protein